MTSTELMVIPFQVSKEEYVIMIVLQDGNIKRIKSYDPVDAPLKHLADMGRGLFEHLKLKSIAIAYCTPEEAQKIQDMCAQGRVIKEVLDLLARGWEFHPEQGDANEARIIMPPGRG